MGPRFRTILCCLLALLPVIFRSVLATPPAHKFARPGSHNKCRYFKSLSSPLLTPPRTFPSTVPLIPNPTEATSASSIALTLTRVSLYTDASRLLLSAPGSTMYSPSELDRSKSDDTVTSGLQQFILYYRYNCDTTACTTIAEGGN